MKDIGSSDNFFIDVPSEVDEITVEVETSGFEVNDTNLRFPMSEEIDVEISDREIVDILDDIFSKNEAIVKKLNVDFDAAISFTEKMMSQHHGIECNLQEVYSTMDFVKTFVDLVTIGVVCAPGYIKSVPSNTKFVFLTDRCKFHVDLRKTNVGMIWKTYPVIKDISEAEINTVAHKFYKDLLCGAVKNQSYFRYFTEQIPDRNAVEKIEDNFSIKDMSDIEVAQLILQNKDVINQIRNVFSKARFNKVVTLAKIIKS